MKNLLYITTTLPALSMTFVYREIEVLRKAGYSIITVSRKKPLKTEISPEALPVYKTTLYLDRISFFAKLCAQWQILLAKPRTWFSLLSLILREKEFKTPSDLPRSLYHFLEAGYLYKRLLNYDISHIHAHILNAPTSVALFLSRYLEIPFSFTMHGSQIYVYPLMLRTKLNLCKEAVTTSEYNRQFLTEKYGNRFAHKIHVIHCGLDPHVFKPKRKTKISPPIILSVGRLVSVKGFAYLLEACSILKKDGMVFQCHIVGDGEESEVLLKKSASLNVQDVVSFLGKQSQDRVRKLLENASIFVLPSIITDDGTREGIPVALMEAMAMELPVVTTKTVGMPELVQNKSEGLLVPQKNAVELALAIGFLLNNRGVRKKMGRRGRMKVIKEFNITHIPHDFRCIFS